jgi:AraC-like DNA-binding protein
METQFLRFDDPEELTETLQPLAPGVRARATRPSGFRSRIRAWSFDGTSFFTYGSTNGSAVFDKGRPYGAVTIPLFSSFGVRVGSRRFDVQDGRLHVLSPDVRGELEPRDGAHVLGFAIDWTRFAKHRRAAAGPWDAVEPVPVTPVSTRSDRGRHFLAHIERLCREFEPSGSLLRDGRCAREVVDTIGCLLAEILRASPASHGGQPDEAMTQRVEEFLTESLELPVSLSDAAIVAGTSTRSLLRAFRKRRGTSPMAFRRRRRFEAARRDLFLADRGETSVTNVAGRYCFDHLGRFAVEYGALFGESPSETLRR